MKILAIIPARGGSERIPRKNIKTFAGKPILAHSIDAAVNSDVFSEVMISTDDHEIAEVAKKFGAKIPFIRSKKNAGDFSTTSDVLFEVFEQYKIRGKEFDYACCIYPTAPFLTGERLKEAFDVLQSEQKEVVIPVLPYEHPIQRALSIEDGKLAMVQPENGSVRSQDLPVRYHDSGQFYFFDVAAFHKQKTLWMQNAGAIILSNLDAHDIDTPTDWQLAEIKLKFRKAY